MFKAARWRSEKNKIKAVFKLSFHATQVPRIGWETMMVSLVPMDTGRPTARTEKVAVIGGACHWMNPIEVTVKFVRDPKTGIITNEKVYRFLVSAIGSAKSGVLGEISINLTDYAEVIIPKSVSLPLKAPDSGVILNVTIQRMQADVEEREGDENGDANVKGQQKRVTIQSKNHDEDKGGEATTTDVYSTEEGSLINREAHLRFPSRETISLQTKSNGNLRKSSSTDNTSASGSDGSSSSGQYTPKENGFINNTITHNESAIFLSPLSSKSTPRKEITGLIDFDWRTRLSTDWPVISDGSVERSRGDAVDLARQDLLAEIRSLREERDALERECEELKSSRKRIGNGNVSKWSHFDGEDSRSLLEELKQELNHEKNLNANLRLQLEKTQESNAELILAVRDLDELLEQKNRETNNLFENGLSHLRSSKCKKELSGTISEDEEQHALEVLVKEHDGVELEYSTEQKIIELNTEIELYRKDCEDLEMQMEQLALDYEILKQENHTVSSKLEQTQLREQLRMQYECSPPVEIVTELEAQVRNLEKEIEEQSEAFEADLESITRAKVEQEQRAIRAEEALRMTRWNAANTAEQLKEEFERLSTQISSTFHTNEELAMQALAEAAELRLEKCQLEESLQKTNEELSLVQGQSHVKIQELLRLLDFKTKEVDKLLLELKNKSDELENQKKSEETRQKALSEDMLLLKAEIERISKEKLQLSEQIEQKEILNTEMEQLKASAKETEMLLRDKELERDVIDRELTSMREEAKKAVEELHDLKQLKDENETMIRTLTTEVEALRAEYSDLKHSLLEDEIEKGNLKKQVFQFRGDLKKKEEAITIIEQKLKESSARVSMSNGTTKTTTRNKNNKSSTAPHGSKEVASLREKIKLLEGRIKLKDAALEDTKNSFLKKEKDLSNWTEQLERSISQSKPDHHEGKVHKDILFNGHDGDNSKDKEGISATFEQQDIGRLQEIENVDKNFYRANTNGKILLTPKMGDKGTDDLDDINRKLIIRSNVGAGSENEEEGLISNSCDHVKLTGVSDEMKVLKEMNKSMEAELKDMQERYSEISLKFAEVEGERQQLVMTIRTLKKIP